MSYNATPQKSKTANILPFPAGGRFCVRVLPDGDGCWYVVRGSHAWLHNSCRDALAEAARVADGYGIAVARSNVSHPHPRRQPMSSYKPHNNGGVLFRNNKRESEKAPDYRGDIDVAGVEYKIAGWIKTAANGSKFMSLALTRADTPKPEAKTENDFHEDAVPF
jgi:hypothetical protein